MKNSPTTKNAPRPSKGKAKGAASNGSGGAAAAAPPFVTLAPPAAEAISLADTLNGQGELVCTDETTLKGEQLLELYRWLQLTRLVEERLVNLYRQTKVVGGVFRSLGQEATAVGTAYALAPQDFIAPLIRDLGAVLVKGIRPRDIFAQYMAKAWGPSEGRDLNIHFGDVSKGFIGPISHLGDMIPVMTGIVLAARMQRKDTVAVAYIGDGGMSTGAFHEGLNFAAVQRLPLVIVAEHNWYAYSTPTSKQTAVANLAEKAAGYGIPGYVVDGNDVVACYEVMRRAADSARGGGGASIIEAKTYRRKGHAEHDDQRYIPAGELEHWERRDPLDRFHRHLVSKGVATQARLDEVVADVRREIEEDSAWAESSPMPDPEKAAYNVFDNAVVPPAFRPKVLEN
ncbi:MAG TPA: thiamine pyrophosphate-dependent dehydrogenase E1 component subunit alpha [Pyrinomonadaceae bacterium]|jgi:pyruvate dehydrogenase E1 component alpha subunit/2-oxoisovalerate dehydrogenase E1 component alpha subunit